MSVAGVSLPRVDDRLGAYQEAVDRRLKEWSEAQYGRRLWAKDPTLWGGRDEPELADRLGWLDLPSAMTPMVAEIETLASQALAAGRRRVVLIGMGGSSLAPEVFQHTFGSAAGGAELSLLDSTHPDEVGAVLDGVPPDEALFIVASKSGTTVETSALMAACWDWAAEASPAPGECFMAVTDPGTVLAREAEERGFRACLVSDPEVGGRFSALSPFGLLPAALIGVDLGDLLGRAGAMAAACGPEIAPADNPGLRLGAVLGELATAGRDKLVFVTSPTLRSFPDWLEQLIAESTGKRGVGVVPIVGADVDPVAAWGNDALFVGLEMSDELGALTALDDLEQRGHPVVRVRLQDAADLGAEMFRWETAVAAAGSALSIHPFNQPDVQLAKELARRAMTEGLAGTEVPPATGVSTEAAAERVAAWLDGRRAKDYLCVQAFVAPEAAAREALRRLQRALWRRTGLPAAAGFGPRFLHSTGQLHKGGPSSGMFLQIIDRPRRDRPVPGAGHTFGELIAAQALGDAMALLERRRRLLRVDVGSDPVEGLSRLAELVAASGTRD